MTSHEWATKLKAMAEEVLGRPEFPLPNYKDDVTIGLAYFSDKERFLAAVRAVGAGTKLVDSQYLTFTPKFGVLNLSVLVKPAVPAEYDCEPLLSQEEVEAL